MPRLRFKPNELRSFIAKARKVIPLHREQLATKLGISGRTLADWQREKYFPDQAKITMLARLSGIPLPKPEEVREDWWSGYVNGSSGGLARLKKYGCSYTLQQRQKGGYTSQRRRKENPEYYRALGCPITRDFVFPKYKTNKLAEFIGILLGDGCIQEKQVSITLNSIADKNYILYVSKLIEVLFQYQPTIYDRTPTKATVLLVSGVGFVDELITIGMKIGNKVRQQVDVPEWIKRSSFFSKWCLRGLMDTDGGIFTNSYSVNGKSYTYPKTNFTNASQPLLDFVFKTLQENGFHPYNNMPRKIWLYSQKESRLYLQIIGSSNDRLRNKIK